MTRSVAITGASGLVGRALTESLLADGVSVVHLVRHATTPSHHVAAAVTVSASSPGQVSACQWSPTSGVVDLERLEGVDALVHLAGESIAGSRWTQQKRERIRRSRVEATGLLVDSLAKLTQPPKVLVSASAIGYYGARGATVVSEDGNAGTGFLSEVCVAWEGAAQRAADLGLRVVLPRLGIVLAAKGGALASMLPPFRLGLGGRLGTGDQYMSWITLSDVVSALRFALDKPDIEGALNLTSTQPVTNRTFTKTLGRVLGRPAFLPVPAIALRIALGQMADELLLTGARVTPTKLLDHGFTFQHTELEAALQSILDG